MRFRAGDPDWGRTKKTLKSIDKALEELNELLKTLEGLEKQKLQGLIDDIESGRIGLDEIPHELGSDVKLLDKVESILDETDSTKVNDVPEVGEFVTGVDTDGNAISGEVDSYVFGKPTVLVDGDRVVIIPQD